MSETSKLPTGLDPWAVLGLGTGAGEEEVRAAYLARVKQFPPERAPEEFERVRDAYEMLRSPRQRAKAILMAAEPGAPLVRLAEEAMATRPFTGPRAWLEIIGEG